MADAVKAVVAIAAKIFTKEAVKQAAIKIAVAVALNAAARMLQPKSKDQSADRSSRFQKQRDSSPYRDVILGTAVTAGTFIDAIAYSTENMFYCEIIKLADHECDGLVAVYAGGRQLTINGDGSVQEYIEGSTPRMWIYFQAGAWGETTHSEVLTAFGGRYTANDRGRGVCRVIIKCDMRSDKLFPSRSPPDLTFAVRGAKIYSPRLDTSLGGSHVWGNYATYQWTDNLADIAYNVARGVFVYGGAQPERLAGGSYDSEELPLANWAAESSACEVLVPLKAAGTERRYRGGLIFSTNEELEGILADLAAGAAGFMLDLGGTLIFQAGVARTPVATLTDADFIAGKLRRTWRQAARERFNTVTGRFTDPALRYNQNTLPIRRSTSDITADNNEERVETMSLGVVQSNTQGQRCMEIRRRSNRLNAMFQVELPPRWQHLEAGDWVTYTSARRGWTKTFVLLPAELKTTGEDMLVSALSMVEVSSNVYTWTPASDELDVINPVAVGPGAIPDATIAGFSAVASANTATNESAPAIEVAWTPPSDPTIATVAIDYKRPSAGTWLTQSFDAKLGVGQITGLAGGNWMVRARPITTPLRPGTASGIVTVSLAAMTSATAGSAATVPWSGVTGGGKPEDNATIGARVGTNIFPNVGSTPLPGTQLLNEFNPIGVNRVRDAGLQRGIQYRSVQWPGSPAAPSIFFNPDPTLNGFLSLVTPNVAALSSGNFYGLVHGQTMDFASASRMASGRTAYSARVSVRNPSAWQRVWVRCMLFNGFGTWYQSSEVDYNLVAGGYQTLGDYFDTASAFGGLLVVWGQLKNTVTTEQIIDTWEPILANTSPTQTTPPVFSVSTDSDAGADRTGENTAAAIAGQGAGATANNLSELNLGEGAKLGGIEAGADVTTNAVPSVEGPKSISFDVDAAGVLSPGSQVPRTLQFIRKRGNTDVSASTTWSIISPVNITLGAITNGGVDVTAVAAGLSNFTVRSIRDGLTIDYLVNVTKNTVASGSTATRNSATTISGLPNDNNWNTLVSVTLNCPNGNLYLNNPSYVIPTAGTGTCRYEARITIDGTLAGSVMAAQPTITSGAPDADVDFSPLFGHPLAVTAGSRTIAIQMRRTIGTGTVDQTDTLLDVAAFPT
jgi:hypothetical protein